MPLALASFLAQEEARPSNPPPSPSPRPISDSIDRVVERVEQAWRDACRAAREKGQPCFPVETAIKGPEVSVRDSLGTRDDDHAPAPGRPPTAAEMRPYRPGPKDQGGAGFDPGCAVKSALKKLKGKNDVYYLYRLRDVHGERVALYDQRLDAATFQGELEFLGRFDGECDALAAYRREQRKTPARPGPGPP